jgi:NAD(P)-dependent dehydrogenase (short-subunit alcohol dehydrogenase family)
VAHPFLDLGGNTVAVVSGNSGIGLAMTIGLAESGAVVATSRCQQQVDDTAIVGPRA